MQRTTSINKPATSCTSALSSGQMRIQVTVPPITTELKAYYFSDGETMMDCILPTSWDVHDSTSTSQMSIHRVSIEQARYPSFNQSKVFHTIKRLIMKYSLNPMIPLPRSHPVFVYDDRMASLVKEMYERVKAEIVDYHCCPSSTEGNTSEKESRLIFPTEKEQERFRFICKYFISRCVVTMKMFQQVLAAANDPCCKSEDMIYGELTSELLSTVTESDIEYPRLHCMIPYAMRHARIGMVSKLETALPRFMSSLVIHPMSIQSLQQQSATSGSEFDHSQLVKKFSFYSSQGLLFPVTFASSLDETSITVMLAPVSGRKHSRDNVDDKTMQQTFKRCSYVNSDDDDSDCVVIFEQQPQKLITVF